MVDRSWSKIAVCFTLLDDLDSFHWAETSSPSTPDSSTNDHDDNDEEHDEDDDNDNVDASWSSNTMHMDSHWVLSEGGEFI